MRSFRYVVADVFTDTPLEGNPVAVFTDGRGLSDEEMQRLARELNLSESVFVLPSEADAHARIRIFTPSAELPFAGHPTLGTAFVLAAPLQSPVVRLETGMGVVPVALEREQDRIVFGRMEQPLPAWEGFAIFRSDCIACHALDRPRDADHVHEITCEDCHSVSTWRTIRGGRRR